MNAIPPKGQMPGKAEASKDDSIHLTMSFEDEDLVAEPTGMGAADAASDGSGSRAQGSADAAPSASSPRSSRSGADGRAAKPDGAPRDRPFGDALLPQFGRIELVLTVEVGSLSIPLKDLIAVEPGQLLALDRMTSEPVSVLVNGKAFALGEIVAVGERYGVRLLEILPSSGGGG